MAMVELRFDDYAKAKPTILGVSGMTGIGRRRFISEALRKANILSRPSYKFPSFSLDDLQSIEDFIVNLYGLGFTNDFDLASIGGLSYPQKLDTALKMVKDVQVLGELFMVVDKGCIVRHDRTITPWFYDLMTRMNQSISNPSLIICLVSKYNPKRLISIQNEDLFGVNLHGLSDTEVSGLLNRCLKLYDRECSIDDFETLARTIKDFPGQVFFTIDLIERIGLRSVLKNLDAVRNYKREMCNTPQKLDS